jgi:hypothetical protein
MTEDADPAILQLYLNAVEMADRVSARRGSANSFFLSLQAGLATVVTFSTSGTTKVLDDQWSAALLALVGLVISATWWMVLRTYRDLNRAKFQVINDIEASHLPVQPFTDEWQVLKNDPVRGWRGRYAEFGTVERVVPCAFAVVYVAVGLRALLG